VNKKMGIRISLAASIAAVLLSLAAASGAAAATEVGDNCAADDSTEGSSVGLFEVSAPANPLPAVVPSGGVITKWKVNVAPTPGMAPQGLRVLRLDPAAKTALVVSEANATITGGQNVFDTRIAVQAGDRLGLFGSSESVGTLLCEDPGGADAVGIFSGPTPVGGTSPYLEGPAPYRIPVAAVVEPDADNDGFGDETQDKCPQSASTQAECPVVVLDSFALAKKGSIVVLVAASESGSVSVGGNAKLPKSSGASSSAKAKLKAVKKNVTAGKIARFTLKLPGKLKAALRDLPKGKAITVKLTATATNVAGQVSKDKSKLKLKG
jgi:hypothetical protein